MSGTFSSGGLITGLDTNNLVAQLMQIERIPLLRFQSRIGTLEKQRDAVSDLRTQLLTLRTTLQDFRFGLDFNQFTVSSSDETVGTATPSGPNPTAGAFVIDVTQLASATVATSIGRIGASITPIGVPLENSGVNREITSGQFTINGAQFNFDFSVSTLKAVMDQINVAGIGVTATYDAATDKVTIENSTPGDTSIINFGGTGDTSNFWDIINITDATQFTNGNGSTEVVSSVGLGRIDEGKTLDTQNYVGGAITGGSFFINGIAITVDPTVDAVSDVIARINDSDAGVTASYDPTTDGIRVVSDNLGSRTISFASGTSNFLDIMNLASANQSVGLDSQFSVDGGPVLTRNSNNVSTVIGDLTINLKSIGTTTLTVSQDQDAVISVIQEFVDSFNESVMSIAELVGDKGELSGDGSIRSIKNFLTSTIFDRVPGLSGGLESLLEIGISTGENFSASAVFQLEIDETKLSAAIGKNVTNIEEIFSNDAETGIADKLFAYLDEISSTGGFLNDRARSNGTIDSQIRSLNERIEAMERRLELKEARLRSRFVAMEQLVATFQSQAGSLLSLGQGLGGF
ncbi:MAG: flagellar filament capping protein FliD [Candidatus Hydrogenedentota bacterium]